MPKSRDDPAERRDPRVDHGNVLAGTSLKDQITSFRRSSIASFCLCRWAHALSSRRPIFSGLHWNCVHSRRRRCRFLVRIGLNGVMYRKQQTPIALGVLQKVFASAERNKGVCPNAKPHAPRPTAPLQRGYHQSYEHRAVVKRYRWEPGTWWWIGAADIDGRAFLGR
jgi:hypothetical protein